MGSYPASGERDNLPSACRRDRRRDGFAISPLSVSNDKASAGAVLSTLVFVVTYAVVVFTIVAQGLTIPKFQRVAHGAKNPV
jgi:hypothetical protein